MPDDRRDQIVLEILSFQNVDALARRARKAWSLDKDSAKKLADETRLEQGYTAHSRKALRMLVEKMEDGTPYATARKQLFPDSFESTDPVDVLPPVRKAIRSLRNPAVERALTELRKLVNEIVRVYAKPDRIRIELARDLKRSRKQRVARTKEIDANTKLREKAKKRILDEMGLTDPRRSILDINVSHRLTKRIAGGLHADTNYSKPHAYTGDDGKTREVRHVRKPLSAMSVSEINDIVDPVIRNKVQAQLARIGGDPKKAFAVPENLPTQDTPDDR